MGRVGKHWSRVPRAESPIPGTAQKPGCGTWGLGVMVAMGWWLEFEFKLFSILKDSGISWLWVPPEVPLDLGNSQQFFPRSFCGWLSPAPVTVWPSLINPFSFSTTSCVSNFIILSQNAARVKGDKAVCLVYFYIYIFCGYFKNSSCSVCLARWIWVGQKLICFCWGLHIYSRCFGFELCSWNSLQGQQERGSGSAGKKAEQSNWCVYIKIYLKLKLKLLWFNLNYVKHRAESWGAWGSSSPGSALYLVYRINQIFRVKILPLSLCSELQTASPQWCADNISLWFSVPWKGIELWGKKREKLDFPLGLNSLSDWSCKSEHQWEQTQLLPWSAANLGQSRAGRWIHSHLMQFYPKNDIEGLELGQRGQK